MGYTYFIINFIINLFMYGILVIIQVISGYILASNYIASIIDFKGIYIFIYIFISIISFRVLYMVGTGIRNIKTISYIFYSLYIFILGLIGIYNLDNILIYICVGFWFINSLVYGQMSLWAIILYYLFIINIYFLLSVFNLVYGHMSLWVKYYSINNGSLLLILICLLPFNLNLVDFMPISLWFYYFIPYFNMFFIIYLLLYIVIIILLFNSSGSNNSNNSNNNNNNNHNSMESQNICNEINLRNYSKDKIIKNYNNNRLLLTGKIIEVIYSQGNYINIKIEIYNYKVYFSIMGFLLDKNTVNQISKGTVFYIINRGINKSYDITDLNFITDVNSFVYRNDPTIIDNLLEVNICEVLISNKKFKSIYNRIRANKCSNNDVIIYNNIKSNFNNSFNKIPINRSNNNNNNNNCNNSNILSLNLFYYIYFSYNIYYLFFMYIFIFIFIFVVTCYELIYTLFIFLLLSVLFLFIILLII